MKRRKGDLNRASEMLAEAVKRPEVLRRMAAQSAFRQWGELVGPQLAKKSRPERFENGTLWVAVTGAAWVQELQMRKNDILKRLNEVAGGELFREVRFGVRPLPKPEDIAAETHEPIAPAEVGVQISEPALESVARSALGRMKAAADRPT